MDDNIVITFHNSNTLETTTKKLEPDIGIVQVPELMGEPLSRLMLITLQQGISWRPIWDPTKSLAFCYHEGMLPSLATLETNLSQIRER